MVREDGKSCHTACIFVDEREREDVIVSGGCDVNFVQINLVYDTFLVYALEVGFLYDTGPCLGSWIFL